MDTSWVWPGDKGGAKLQEFNMISHVYAFAISQNNKRSSSKWRKTKCDSVSLEFRDERAEFTYIIWRVIKVRIIIAVLTKGTIYSQYEKRRGATQNLQELQHLKCVREK